MKRYSVAAISCFIIILALAASATAWQDQSSSSTQHQSSSSQDQSSSPTLDQRPRPVPQPVQLVPHTTKAVDYKQGSSSKLELKGTSLMPEVSGDAEVKTRTGRTEIE